LDTNVPGEPAVRSRNYVLTGAPGAGKTTLIERLRARGEAVVEEAFMSVWRRLRAEGCADPLADPSFIDQVVRLQAEQVAAARSRAVPRQYFDRSVLCTLALSDFMGRQPGGALLREVARVQAEHVFERSVFFILDLGHVPGNEVGTMKYEDMLAFAEVHRRVYLAHGYRCVDVPALPVEERVELILEHSGGRAR
jgi:predicted ATPase